MLLMLINIDLHIELASQRFGFFAFCVKEAYSRISMENKEEYTPRPSEVDIYAYLVGFVKWLGEFMRRNPEMNEDGALEEVRKSLIKKAADVAGKHFDRDTSRPEFSSGRQSLAA